MFEKVNAGHPDKMADRIAGAIVDESVGGVPYAEIVEKARLYIHTLGGFEKFAEWGLIRPKE